MQGFGTELSTLLLAIMIIDKVVVPLWKNWRESKTLSLKTQKVILPNLNNPNDKPGSSQECKDHMKKLTALETEINNINKEIEEIKKNNREDHKEIFKELSKRR